MNAIERLFEREGLPAFDLPADLAKAYGGGFGLAREVVYANFVVSLDGVAALPGGGESGGQVSGGDEPDRLVMGLLRAAADAVVIGAGTFRKAPGDLWRPGSAYPPATAAYAELRRNLGLREHPLLVLVTGSGDLDTTQAALEDCLILTTPAGENRLLGTLPRGARVAVAGGPPIGGRAVLEILHAEGLRSILLEGGPTLLGQWLGEDLIEELYLTMSPRLFGRFPGDHRKALVEGLDLGGRRLELASLGRQGSHLYLRFSTGGQGPHSERVPNPAAVP